MNILIDLSSVLWRALLAGKDEEFGRDIEFEGKKVHVQSWQHGYHNAIGLILRALKQLGGVPSDCILVEEGMSSKKLRLAISSEYKAQRGARPPEQYEEFGQAKVAIINAMRAVGASSVKQDGVEADDVLAYLADKLPHPVIVTFDGDLCQCVKKGVNVLRDFQFNPNPYGDFPHEYITVYKALVGDSSDNIPGAYRFGEAAFKKLLDRFGVEGLEAMRNLIHTNALHELAEDVAEMKELQRIIDSTDAVQKSYRLARLYPEAVNTNRSPLRWTAGLVMLKEEISDPLLREFGAENIPVTAENWPRIEARFWEDVKQARFYSLDIETSTPEESDDWIFQQAGKEDSGKVDVIGSELTGLGLTVGKNSNRNYYFSVDHFGEVNLASLTVAEIIQKLPATKPTVIQNVNFELPVLKLNWGDGFQSAERGFLPNIEDTKLMASYVNENLSSGLKQSSKHYLGYEQASYEATTTWTGPEAEWNGRGRIMERFEQVQWRSLGVYANADGDTLPVSEVAQAPEGYTEQREVESVIPMLRVSRKMNDLTLAEVLSYGCDDTRCTAALYRHYCRIMQIEGTYNVYRHVEIDAAYLVAQAMVDGCTFNAEAWARVREQDARTLAKVKPVMDAYLCSVGWDGSSMPVMDGKVSTFKWFWQLVHGYALTTRRQKLEILLKSDLQVESLEVDGEMQPVDQQFLSLTQSGLDSGDWSAFETYCAERFQPDPQLNIGSPTQLCKLMYEVMALPIRLRNPPTEAMRRDGIREGNPRADETAIDYALKYDCGEKPEVATALKALKTLKTLHTRQGLFLEPYAYFKHWKTGKIHSSMNQSQTVTRRFSSSAPNVQQLPSKGEGLELRDMFAAHHGNAVVVSLDFSGQELRLAADLSQDPNMLSCYVGDNLRDIHSITATKIAASLWNLPNLTYDEFYARFKGQDRGEIEGDDAILARKSAKPVNFGKQYDATAPTIAEQLIIFEDEAQIYCDAYDEAFPGVQKWKDVVVQQAHKYGYALTKLGARRHLRDLLNDDRSWVSRKAERQGPNFCIQSSGAEQAKLVMGRIWRSELYDKYDYRFMMPVHDEIVQSVHKDQALEIIPILHRLMTLPYANMSVPIVSSIDIGPAFGSMTGIGESPEPAAIQRVLNKLFPAHSREAVTATNT